MLATACGGLPTKPVPGSDGAPLSVKDPADTALVRIARASLEDPQGSGFRLFPLGVYSLDARVELIRRAQRSLDLQYYYLADDSSGRLILDLLVQAAARGVKVRLLIDDLHTAEVDETLHALAGLPNFAVRLFNPFCCGRGSLTTRVAGSLFDLSRINHRMHNKLLVADGVMAILGGRNLADEYFTRNPLQNFVDMDVLVAGAAVPQLSASFERYWDSDPVYDIVTLYGGDTDASARAAVQERLRAADGDGMLKNLPPFDVLGYEPIGHELDAGRIAFTPGQARAHADPPEKVLPHDMEWIDANSVLGRVRLLVAEAKQEVVLTSPYLVPRERGIELLHKLHERQVKVVILTNSLAANDSGIVHTGYARYRAEMLRQGVDLYELSPGHTVGSKQINPDSKPSSLGSLHAKLAVIDRSIVLIGSANLDPRSSDKNTELGMAIDSPALARETLHVINVSRLQSAYRVRFAPDGKNLEWLSFSEGEEKVFIEEPESTFWSRIGVWIFAPLIPEELL